MPRKIHMPTEAEDKAINRAAESDPDNPPLTDDLLLQMQTVKRGRPVGRSKERVNMSLDRDLVEVMRASGRGWQTRANEILRKAMGLNHAGS